MAQATHCLLYFRCTCMHKNVSKRAEQTYYCLISPLPACRKLWAVVTMNARCSSSNKLLVVTSCTSTLTTLQQRRAHMCHSNHCSLYSVCETPATSSYHHHHETIFFLLFLNLTNMHATPSKPSSPCHTCSSSLRGSSTISFTLFRNVTACGSHKRVPQQNQRLYLADALWLHMAG